MQLYNFRIPFFVSNGQSRLVEVPRDESIELLDCSLTRYRRREGSIGETTQLNAEHDVGASPSEPVKTPFKGFTEHLPRSCFGRKLTAWKGGVALNIIATILVLAVNLTAPAWATGGYRGNFIFSGTCAQVKYAALGAHAAINVLGTTVLAASNYAMQILSSPSRHDIDMAHHRGQPFSIGVPSLSNLRIVGRYRTTLWLALAASSIPLHLVYNSMVFSTTNLNGYRVAVVQPEFLDGSSFNLSTINIIPWMNTSLPIDANDQLLLERLQTKAKRKQLIEMSNEQCIRTYFWKMQVNYRNVLAVTEMAVSNSSVVWLESSNPRVTPYYWVCRYRRPYGAWQDTFEDSNCVPDFEAENPANWSLGLYDDDGVVDEKWTVKTYPISKCFVEEGTTGACSLKYDTRLFVVVITANVIKVIAMIATLLQYKQPALVTLGDALASFLQHPDQTTRGMCLSLMEDFSFPVWERRPRSYWKELEGTKRLFGASRQQRIVVTSTFTVTMLLGLALFSAIYDGSSGLHWSSDTTERSSIKIGVGHDDATLIVLSNLPQILLSFNYLMLNRLMTCMTLSREWSLFAHRRKSLRTSNPQGEQRSTYWLQLPLRFGIPMMVSSAGLHYLASQALFYGSIRTYSPYDEGNTGLPRTMENYSGLGYSQDAAQVLLISLLMLNTVVILVGRSQNKAGIPQGVLNSAVIAASCHPPSQETDAHLKPVKWGEIESCRESSGLGHCSFSSGTVVAPTPGREYM